jgi:hypothetical protein
MDPWPDPNQFFSHAMPAAAFRESSLFYLKSVLANVAPTLQSKMVVPEQYIYTAPTEHAMLIDVVRESGGLNRYCFNVENGVLVSAHPNADSRNHYTIVKTRIHFSLSVVERVAQSLPRHIFV